MATQGKFLGFVALILQNLPEIPDNVMDGWSDNPEALKKFLRGLRPPEPIDCNTAPSVPEGWKIASHKMGGSFNWNPRGVRLHLSPNQQGDKIIGGNELREELTQEPVFNTNLLDFLLANTELVPREWDGNAVIFWGTTYFDSEDNLCVRSLVCDGGRYTSGHLRLDEGFNCHKPSACMQAI